MDHYFKNLIFVSLIYTLQLSAMDGEQKRQANQEQAAQEAHPTKEEIAKTIVQTNIMPNVLAPLIAAYAENPCKKYMFIQKESTLKVESFQFDFLKEYTAKYPQLSKGLTANSLMLSVCIGDKRSCFEKSDSRKPFTKMMDCDCLNQMDTDNFPFFLPAEVLKYLKEGDHYYAILNGKPYEFICCQLGHFYGFDNDNNDPCPFENRFAIETAGKLESAKEDDE